MKIAELKQRQKLKDIDTGEILQVSKRDNGVFLVNPLTKKAVYVLARHSDELQQELNHWVAA